MAKAGRAGVEFEDVAAALAALGAEGIRPTIRAIRDRIGRGSLGTIQRHLAAMQDRGGTGTGATVAIPESVATALAKWVTQELERDVSELREELNSARETIGILVAENETVTAARDEGLERESDLQRGLDAAGLRIESLGCALSEVRAEVVSANAAERSASENLVRAEVRLEQLQSVEDEAMRSRRRVSELETACAELRLSLASAETQTQVLAERLTAQAQRADQDREDAAAKTAALDVERQRREVAEAEVMRITRLLERLVAVAPERDTGGGEGKTEGSLQGAGTTG